MKVILLIFVLVSGVVYSQQKLIPLQSFYKEKFIQFSGKKSISTFYPQNESELNTQYLNRDSSKQYFDFSERLYKHHLLELKTDVGQINIDPLINFSRGRYNFDSTGYQLYRNTRGIFIEGQVYDKVSFQFTFTENQSRFQNYERQYMASRGELYIFPGPRYSIQNAVVPGGSRTKPFKEYGLDYAYSTGMIRYAIHPKLAIEAGNNQHFIGSGYRSLLLSDNGFYAPNVRINWKIHPKFEYQVLYQKNLNLYRKPLTKAVESNYEIKFYALSYLTFKPSPSFSISLFSAGNQLLGDSMIRHPFVTDQLIPLPFFQNDFTLGCSRVINGINGINIDWALKNARIYGQVVTDRVENLFLVANQFGFYWFDAFKIKNAMIQLEWNQVPKNFYSAKNPKLAYSQFNLPAAHPKGNNFNELFLKLFYEKKRFYIQAKTSIYLTQGGTTLQQFEATSIFNGLTLGNLEYGNTITGDYELGWRFNRLYNGNFFVKYQGRSSVYDKFQQTTNCIWFGLKTSLSNEYFDF
ncbi:MAG: hypothetical protein ACK48V_08275 [Crocinitomicaceae bacterium]|jgi:hypothetical protein